MTDFETIRRVQGLRNRQPNIRRTCFFLSAGFILFGLILTYNLLK